MNNNELHLAYQVRHALNENLDLLPASTADRLATARKIALSRKKQHAGLRQFANSGLLAGVNASFSWLNRMSVAVPMLVVVAGLVGIFQFEQQQRIEETAEIDAMVLSDELPPTAYLDHGFNAYLSKREVH